MTHTWHQTIMEGIIYTSSLPFSMMTSSNGNNFRAAGPLRGQFTSYQWLPLTKASDAELCCFLWSQPEQTVERTNETPGFETPSRSLVRLCNVFQLNLSYVPLSHKKNSFYHCIFVDVMMQEGPWTMLVISCSLAAPTHQLSRCLYKNFWVHY